MIPTTYQFYNHMRERKIFIFSYSYNVKIKIIEHLFKYLYQHSAHTTKLTHRNCCLRSQFDLMLIVKFIVRQFLYTRWSYYKWRICHQYFYNKKIGNKDNCIVLFVVHKSGSGSGCSNCCCWCFLYFCCRFYSSYNSVCFIAWKLINVLKSLIFAAQHTKLLFPSRFNHKFGI